MLSAAAKFFIGRRELGWRLEIEVFHRNVRPWDVGLSSLPGCHSPSTGCGISGSHPARAEHHPAPAKNDFLPAPRHPPPPLVHFLRRKMARCWRCQGFRRRGAVCCRAAPRCRGPRTRPEGASQAGDRSEKLKVQTGVGGAILTVNTFASHNSIIADWLLDAIAF